MGSVGKHVRRVGAGVIGALALASALIASVPATGASAAPINGNDRNGTYLALGDSVAFGYVPPDATPAPNYLIARSFVSYANYVAQALDERVSNASCPGETTASMLDPTAQSNGCENSYIDGQLVPEGYRTLNPLHVQYRGSQMDYALSYLARHKHTMLITIDIGANDGFLCQENPHVPCGPAQLAAVLQEIATNLSTIFTEIRDVAGYKGPLVALDYYSLDYNSPQDNASSQLLNGVINQVTQAFGGIVADGYGAFENASPTGDPCAAGLLIPVPGGCNIHPSQLGHQVLAEAIESALQTAGV
jgi:lysophospholipase L1-like esterase